MSDLRLVLKITGDASGLKAEVAGAQRAVDGLGAAGRKAGDDLGAGLRPPPPVPPSVPESYRKTGEEVGKAGRAAGVTAQQMQQLAPQLNDLATQIASGGGLLLPLIQQAGQITPIFGGLAGTIRAATAALLSPAGLVVAGAAALGGMVAYGEASLRTFNGLQNQLRATRSDYLALAATVTSTARDFAAGGPFGRADSRSAAATLAGSSAFAGGASDLRQLLTVSGDLAAVMGRSLPDAAGILAKAMRDPASVAQELAASGFRGFNPTVARQIELLQAAGLRGQAFAEVMTRIRAATAGAASNQTELQQAWQRLGDGADALADKLRPVAIYLAQITGSGLNALANLLPGGSPAAGGATFQPGSDRSATNSAVATALSLNPRIAQIEANRAQRQGLQAGLAGASTEEAALIRGALQANSAQAYGLRGPAAEYFSGLQDQVALARQPRGAAQTIFAAQQQFIELQRRDGAGATPAQLGQVERSVQSRLFAEHADRIGQLNDEADGQERVAEATRNGALAAAEAAEKVRAEEEARRVASMTSERYGTVVIQLTAAYGRLRTAQQAVRDAQALSDQEQQLELIRREGELVGATTVERQRELAVLRERQRIQREGGDPTSEASQARMRNAGTIAEATEGVRRQQAGYEELGRIGENAFDNIGQAITQASLSGQTGFRDLNRVGLAVASELTQAFVKLALLNPIKNALGMGNSSTLMDVFSAVGGSYRSGTGAFYGSGPTTIDASGGGFLFHTGGIAGHDAAPFRAAPAALFSNAQRFHAGGAVGPDEVPAILRRGEGVFTPEQMARLSPASGGGATFAPTIHFTGNAGSPEDRDALIQGMRTLWLQDLLGSVPGIITAAKGSLRQDVQRMGVDRALGSVA